MADTRVSEAETHIVMPKLGLTMQEGVLSEWRVAPGDEVNVGQIMFVVETDKISNEVEAPASGRITRLLAETGETLAVGAPVALWTGPGSGADASNDAQASPQRASLPDHAPPTVTADPRSARVLATPLARRVASRAHVSLAAITGTGPRGRIQARDVQAAIARAQETAILAPANIAEGTAVTREGEIRRLIAARLTRSKAEIPHFYVVADARFDALAALRRDLSGDPASPKLSVTAFLIASVARALAMHPRANVAWRDGQVTPFALVGVGVAVDTPIGVMLPVIQGADKFAPHELAASLAGAIARAREGKLRASDVGRAAMSVSNVGMHNVRALTPIIDPDQTYILGVGAPQSVVRPNAQGMPCALGEVTLTLACDHRAVDGALAAQLLSSIVSLLESPSRLLLAPTSSALT